MAKNSQSLTNYSLKEKRYERFITQKAVLQVEAEHILIVGLDFQKISKSLESLN